MVYRPKCQPKYDTTILSKSRVTADLLYKNVNIQSVDSVRVLENYLRIGHSLRLVPRRLLDSLYGVESPINSYHSIRARYEIDNRWPNLIPTLNPIPTPQSRRQFNLCI